MKQELGTRTIGRSRGGGGSDLVFDFAGIGSPDLGALCLMLTACILADGDQRKVWLHGLPEHTWRLLHVMGLEHYFELLPQTGELVN